MTGRRVLLALLFTCMAAVASADDALWEKLSTGGYLLLIRHAQTTPGVGDPPDFAMHDCRTQRNLNDAGRAQAQRLGETLRRRGVSLHEIRSSRWCRCLDTARLAFGRAQPWSPLDSTFHDVSRAPQMRAAVAALAAEVRPPRNVVLVTHGANIRSLVGVHPAPAEIVVARGDAGTLQLVGRLPLP